MSRIFPAGRDKTEKKMGLIVVKRKTPPRSQFSFNALALTLRDVWSALVKPKNIVSESLSSFGFRGAFDNSCIFFTHFSERGSPRLEMAKTHSFVGLLKLESTKTFQM